GPPTFGVNLEMSRMFHHEPTPENDREDRPDRASPPDEREDADELAHADDADELIDDLDGLGDDDTALEPDSEATRDGEEAEPAAEDEYAGGPDDALGLYLRQMGAIPLLNKEKEKALAQRLEHHRNRFRAAALLCPRVLARVVEKFEQIAACQTPIDPN